MTMEDKVDLKTAEAEFDKFVELWDIDGEVEEMDQDDRQGFLDQKRRFVRAVRAGRAVVDEKGGVEYRFIAIVNELDSISLKIPKGVSYMAMDRYKERQNMHKMQAFMADMSGQPVKVFANMDGRDMKFCMAVVTLFLGS